MQVDRELLAFAVRFPEYRDALAAENVSAVLTSERSRGFWRKLCEFDSSTILQHLDAGEKKFYVSCRMRADVEPEGAEEQWREYLEYFESRREARDRTPLREKLHQARQRGDFREELRLLALYDKSLSR
jgi:DNA primase